MHQFPPNINWRITTFLATFLGYVGCGDFTAYEQIAIGNWMLQIGQTMLTNATYQQMIEKRMTGDEKINLNGKKFKQGASPFISPPPPFDFKEYCKAFGTEITDEEINYFHKAIQRINDELEKISKELNKK